MRIFGFSISIVALAAMAGAANAQSRSIVVHEAPASQSSASVAAFWTPERLMRAKPMNLRPAAGFMPKSADGAAGSRFQQVTTDPSPGEGEPMLDNMIHPARAMSSGGDDEVAPAASMSNGLFTESRVSPVQAVNATPFRRVGKLFFHDPRTGEDFVCSASAQSYRLILTAGHCVAHGSTSSANRYFYTNFLYVPSYNNGAAPYGQWGWAYAATTTDWYNNGTVPNGHDFALIEATDNASGQRLGSVTGFLGSRTLSISSNHLTILGYPCNLDSCNIMQRTDAQTFASGGNNTWIYGSSMRGGASGGPWVQDFGVKPVGDPTTSGGNWATAVTSYGPVSTSVGYLGASQFDSVFTSLRTTVCNHRVGNCTP